MKRFFKKLTDENNVSTAGMFMCFLLGILSALFLFCVVI